jgi:hypothetical protein
MSDNVPPYPNVRNELDLKYYSHHEGHDSQTQDTTCDIDEVRHTEIAMKYVKQRQERSMSSQPPPDAPQRRRRQSGSTEMWSRAGVI